MDFNLRRIIKLAKQVICYVFFISLVNGLLACTFLPGIKEEQPYVSEQCKLVTRRLDLDIYGGMDKLKTAEEKAAIKSNTAKTAKTTSSGSWYNPNMPPESILVLVGIATVWAGATFIVSGSIVVTGNILHWSEYQGRCDGNELRQYVYRH